MDTFPNLEIEGGEGVFRLAGHHTLSDAVHQVAAALRFARGKGIDRLLIVITDLHGFAPPTTTERYFLIHQWAEASGGQVRFAVVARPEMIDAQKFGATVAANLGVAANIFDRETDAVAWLREPG